MVVLLLSSCGTMQKSVIVPVATNTISTVSFNDLNLQRDDYKILNTIEVESLVTFEFTNKGYVKITDDSGYVIEITKNEKTGLVEKKSSGVLRAGFLTNDYGNVNYDDPESIARAVTFSKLVAMAKEYGADALIEPIVATSLEEQVGRGSRRTIVYHTTASAKIVVIKTDK